MADHHTSNPKTSDAHPSGAAELPAGELPAGEFSAWMNEIVGAIRDGGDSDVPCGSCTACCTASQFVHIGPEERDTIAHIPKDLLFAAPRLPRGHMLMGYDDNGRCPMLIDDACSIYAHRPRTCRTYDCRVFPAAGIEPDETTKVLIARRVRRWRFSHPSARDRVQHDSVLAAAEFLGAQPDLPDNVAPATSTQRAVMAVQIADLFVGAQDPHDVRVEVIRRMSRAER